MATNSHSSSIPNGWRLARLGDICNAPEYGAPASAIPFDATLPRYVRISDVTDDGRIKDDDRRSAEPNEVDGYELHDGDLLFARSGSVGRTYLYRAEDGPCVFAGYLIRFRPRPEQATAAFLSHFTHSRLYTRWVAATARRGAQHNINAAEYSSLPIPLPPLHEQRRIAKILDSIDEAIERAETVISSMERLRDALLHELLTKGVPGWHTEWKDAPNIGQIPACWEVARLGDVATLQRGVDLPVQDRLNGSIPVYGSNGILDHHANTSQNGPGVITGRSGSIGLVYYSEGPYWPLNTTLYVRDFHGNSERFIYHFLGHIGLERFAASTGVPSLNRNFVHPYLVALPPLPEQQAIAEALDGVESAIELARTHVSILKLTKESAADALLTGRVRVAGE